VLDQLKKYPVSLAQFSKKGTPYVAGEILRQPDLARTLERIADQGPAGFYAGQTALPIEKEMASNGGLITRADLTNYKAERAYADRARYLGDPAFNPQMPIERLISKEYAVELRRTIDPDRASKSSPTSFEWPHESAETTHLSVVDANRTAVSLTTRSKLRMDRASWCLAPGSC
jgi:gamma-glutamyltranspeptidase / glutathione hydrolase